jgi:hypothetical protein
MSNSWLREAFRVPDWLTLDGHHHLPAATLTLEDERAYLEDDERRARAREGFAYAAGFDAYEVPSSAGVSSPRPLIPSLG